MNTGRGVNLSLSGGSIYALSASKAISSGLEPGCDALLFFIRGTGSYRPMPNCTDTAGHTTTLDCPVMDH